MGKIGEAWILIRAKRDTAQIKKQALAAGNLVIKTNKRTQKNRLTAEQVFHDRVAKLQQRALAENITRDKRAFRKSLRDKERLVKASVKRRSRIIQSVSTRIGGRFAGIGAVFGGPGGAVAGLGLDVALGILKKTTKALFSFARVLTKVVIKALSFTIKWVTRLTAVLGLLAVGATLAASKLALQAESINSMFGFIFTESTKAAREWSDTFAEAVKRTPTEIRKQLGIFFQMIKTMGISEDAALSLGKSFTQLTFDMSSFFGATVTAEQAFLKLTSGLTGEVEPLKRVGILIKEETVKQFAWATGIADVNKELSEQQKLLARALLILQQTRTMHNNLIDTMEEATNQFRAFKSMAVQVGQEIGFSLLPSVKALFSTLNPLLSGLRDFLRTNQEEISKNVLGIAKVVGSFALGLAALTRTVLAPMFDWLLERFNNWKTEIPKAIDIVQKAVNNAWFKVLDVFGKVIKGLKILAGAFVESFKLIADAVNTELDRTEKRLTTLVRLKKELFGGFGAGALLDEASGAPESKIGALKPKLAEVFGGVKASFQSIFGSPGDTKEAQGIFTKAFNALKNLVEDSKKAFEDTGNKKIALEDQYNSKLDKEIERLKKIKGLNEGQRKHFASLNQLIGITFRNKGRGAEISALQERKSARERALAAQAARAAIPRGPAGLPLFQLGLGRVERPSILAPRTTGTRGTLGQVPIPRSARMRSGGVPGIAFSGQKSPFEDDRFNLITNTFFEIIDVLKQIATQSGGAEKMLERIAGAGDPV